jgi:hypothetical protein
MRFYKAGATTGFDDDRRSSMSWKISIAALALAGAVAPTMAAPPRVHVETGDLAGTLEGDTAIFKGIP